MAQSSSTGSAAFAQQGTVDWTAISGSTFTFSVEVMSRFSKAGVEMITCAMGQAMCSRFNVPPEGQKRVTDAISKLKAYSSYGQVLWFGFGVKHIVRSLCETKQGATCAALCACLRVSYSTEMSARVLSVLCDRLLPSDGLSPALPQWAALSDVCSGALSPSKFPVMVDGFCRLAFTDRRPHSRYHKATTVDALAHALAELSKVSNGSVSSITFEGGYDCGWIAAVAEWLLCLKVKVLTDEGSCLYWQDSSHTNDSAQVIIVFNTLSRDHDLAKTKEVRVVNRSFRLPCDGEVQIIHRVGAESGETFGMGRSSWSTILEDTFGSVFKMLLSPNIIETFTKMLLSVIMARPSDSAMVYPPNRREAIHPWVGPFSSPAASRERAFFLAIANQLPELSPLLETLENIQKSACAAAGPEESQLWNFCDCEFCGQRSRKRPFLKGHIVVNTHICLHHLAMTLITLIWLLSTIKVDETIQPASIGLLMLYNSIVSDISNTFEGPVPSEQLWWHNELKNIYPTTLELFTGLPSHLSRNALEAASAICHGGICIWLPALENPLYDPSKQMIVRVIPGNVSFRDRLYREIVDIGKPGVPIHSALVMPAIAAYGTSRVSKLLVRETLDASRLEASIELGSGKTSNAFGSYLDQLGVEHSQCLPSVLGLHIRMNYGSLIKRIDNIPCEVNLGRVRSQRLPKPDLTTWDRPCPTLALLLESTTAPKRSYNYPEAGEWVLVIKGFRGRTLVSTLIRGDFTLLYYLMVLEQREERFDVFLAVFDGCIRCFSCRSDFGPIMYRTTVGLDYQINIHTIRDDECANWSAKLTRKPPRRRIGHSS